jgi:hypothetical protein
MKTLRAEDTAAIFDMVWPSAWKDYTATVRLTVKDKDTGDLLIDNELVDPVLLSTVTDGEVGAGRFQLTLDDDRDYKEGDVCIIGTANNGYRFYTVDGYDSAFQLLSLQTGLDELVVDGAEVYCANYEYAQDISACTATNLSVLWSPSVGKPFAEERKILRSISLISELQSKFDAAFPSLYSEISSVFDLYERRSRESLRKDMERKGRDIRKVVDTEAIEESLILEIAYFAAIATQIDEEQYQRIVKAREEERLKLDALALWVDTNQNGQVDEGEEERALVRNFSRGIF